MATPGELNITLYYNASHGLVIQFKDSDGNDFDISSYTDFLMRLYPVSSRSQIGSDIELTRTGSQLDHTFSVEDIQGYPSNMRHEILFKNGADVDPVLRGDLTVTDVLKDDTISTSAEVTLTSDTTVVTVSDVTIVNALGEIKDQAEETTPPDSSNFIGQKSDNTLFRTTWANIKSTIKTWLQSNFAFNDLSDGTITNGAENDLLTLESGVWVNKSIPSALSKILAGRDYNDILAWDNFIRDDGDIGTSDSSHTWNELLGDWTISNNYAVSTGASSSSPSMAVVNVDPSNYNILSRFSYLIEGTVVINVNEWVGFVVAKDVSNYILFLTNQGSLRVDIILDGVRSTVETINNPENTSRPRHTARKIKCGLYRRSATDFMFAMSEEYSGLRFDGFRDLPSGGQSVFSGATNVGIYTEGSHKAFRDIVIRSASSL